MKQNEYEVLVSDFVVVVKSTDTEVKVEFDSREKAKDYALSLVKDLLKGDRI